jgi:glycosyltransferase involved in cell wall biosynthesis
MRLAVVSHKVCWPHESAESGHATDGGFPFQIHAISELFDETRLLVPVIKAPNATGALPLSGRALSIVALTAPSGKAFGRKLRFPVWLAQNVASLLREISRADAVHTPIPGDVGTIGLLIALMLRKPLLIRHCGNWYVRRTAAEFFWRWILERSASARTVVLATGGGATPPSARNPSVRWIFATSLREAELREYGVARTQFRPAGPRLIIAARQERAKGTGAVIQSLPLIVDQYPNVSLDVVGDGDALPEFRMLAANCGVANRVRFHGKLDHAGVMTLLQAADVFCFPTTSSEGFPKAVLEALACGLPVVTTRVSVLGELISAGGGILLDEPTPVAVARGIRWCLADEERYRLLSARAIRTASGYSLEKWRDTIASLLIPSWGPLSSSHA